MHCLYCKQSKISLLRQPDPNAMLPRMFESVAKKFRFDYSVFRRLTLLLCVSLILCSGISIRAQETPKEVRVAAQAALGAGDFGAAAGFLQQLVDWYADSKQDNIRAMMADIYYNLGLCHFFLADFPQARASFDTYLKRHRRGIRAEQIAVLYADTYRFENKLKQALKHYRNALKNYPLNADLKADVFAAMARCHLAEEEWATAIPFLLDVYHIAPDFTRRNWAATLLAISYLNDGKLNQLYQMVPMLLRPQSFASRSVAFNLAALQVGDEIFAEEHYRDALWIYRLVYPHDLLTLNSELYLDFLQKRSERVKTIRDNPRPMIRVQEQIADLEAEIEALEQIENYDPELFFRMARAYMEISRYREARDLFYYLYDENTEGKAEECLYLAFVCSSRIVPWDRAFEIGEEYMEAYPGGEYYDPLTLTMGQLYARKQDWPKVISVLTTALDVSPKHEDVVECMFLIGYACFMEEAFTDAADWLIRMNKEYPGNEREADGTYWTGMAYLFDKNYEDGLKYFDRLIDDFPACTYIEDATFRSATCTYGLSEFGAAESKFLDFIKKYPDSKLVGETYVMLGDISGTFGELVNAVTRFQKVPQYGDNVNIELYNYAMFRCGEMLSEMEKYDDLISHFKRYLERDREGSNIPMAVFWIGNGYWDKGAEEKALQFYLTAIGKYGHDRHALGVDLILEEWVGKSRSAEPAVAKSAWKKMHKLYKQAIDAKQITLALRLKRILTFDPSASEKEKAVFRRSLLREQLIPHASAGLLEYIATEAMKEGRPKTALAAANELINEFTETDYALSARMLVAQDAIEHENYAEAIKNLNIIREVYAASDEAAQALLLLGRLYREQDDLGESDKCYTAVLGVKEWRSLWPEALYGRGETARANRSYEKACAYFERIYLLYTAYTKWASKAYLARAECLTRLHEDHKAIETIQEMQGIPEMMSTPEYPKAQELLKKLERRI